MTQQKENIFLDLKQEAMPKVIENRNLSKYRLTIDAVKMLITFNFH